MSLLPPFLWPSSESKKEHSTGNLKTKVQLCSRVTLGKPVSSLCFSFLVHHVKEYYYHFILSLPSVKFFWLQLTEPQKRPHLPRTCVETRMGLAAGETIPRATSALFPLLSACSLSQTGFFYEVRTIAAARSQVICLQLCHQVLNKMKVLFSEQGTGVGWQSFIICPIFLLCPYFCLTNISIIASFSYFPHFILTLVFNFLSSLYPLSLSHI